MKKIPIRKCVATHESLPKNELLRIVKTPNNTIEIDFSGKLNGRGAYLKKTGEALTIAKKKRALELALEIKIPDEIYQKLDKIIHG